MMMMMAPAAKGTPAFSRTDRVRKALMREIADIIKTDLKDHRLDDQVISVTDVELSKDISIAKVYISILADEALQTDLMTILMSYTGKIRKAVGQRIQLRHTPEIHLFLDHSLERGMKLQQLLDKLSKGEVV
jgi:ribosome-binding factor A